MDRLNVQPKLLSPVTNTSYNEANQMLSFNDATMTYDENGNLTSVTNSCGTTTYTWDARNRLVGINGFTADCSPLTANFKYDALGSIVALTDDLGNVKTHYNYSPFGETEIIGESSNNPFQYTGRENDGTGLYYYRARYYSPVLKRFISEDPIGLLGVW